MYQQIRQAEEQTEADNTLEQSELQLSGLVVKQHNKLRIYNPIYKEVFNSYWIKNQLKNLRPYSENFRFWVDSKGTDESRLLRGKALQEAEEWAKDKNLSYQDKQYLAASKEKEIKKEIAAKEQKSALEREQKNREAAEKRNQVLSEANKKAQRRISIGFVVLVITVLGAATVGLFSKKQLDEVQEQVEAVRQLNKLAGELQKNSNSDSEELTIIEKVTFDSNEALRLSALSLSVDNHQLKQALVFAVRGQAYQQLKKLKEAEQQFTQSQEFLLNADKNAKDSSEGLQIQVLFHKFQGSLLAQNKETLQAIESYNKAFDILKKHPKEIDFTKSNPLVTAKDIESFHRIFIELLSKNNTEPELRKWVEESLTQHLYAQLEYYLKAKDWRAADNQTYLLMLNIGQGEELESDVNFDNFSCPHLEKIDSLWVANSDKRFGFSVQKKILIEIGNTLSEREDRYVTEKEIYENFLQLAKAIGLYRNGSKVQDKVNLDEEVVSDGDVGRGELDLRGKFVYFDPNFIGSLPLGYGELGRRGLGSGYGRLWVFMSTIETILSRFATCKQ